MARTAIDCHVDDQMKSGTGKNAAESAVSSPSEPVYNELQQYIVNVSRIENLPIPMADETVMNEEEDDEDDDDEEEEKFYLDIQFGLEVEPISNTFSNCTTGQYTEDTSLSMSSVQQQSLTADEIHELYAKVDKSKKKKYRLGVTGEQEPSTNKTKAQPKHIGELHPNKVNDLHPKRVIEFDAINETKDSKPRKELQWPDHMCGKGGSAYHSRAESRPLPPIPTHANDNADVEADSHIYDTLPKMKH